MPRQESKLPSPHVLQKALLAQTEEYRLMHYCSYPDAGRFTARPVVGGYFALLALNGATSATF
jgi:hypothetical protein